MINNQNIPWKRLSVEAAAIVASILLAFAIDAWWEARREVDLAQSYIARLQADIEFDLQAYEVTVAWAKAIDASSRYVLDVYRGADPSRDAYDLFAYHIFRASWSPQGRTTSATYNDLISTGNLGLLSVQIRNEISDYYSQKEEYIERRGRTFEENARRGYWRVPSIVLGPEATPRIWQIVQGRRVDFVPEIGSLELTDADKNYIVQSLRNIGDLDTQIAEIRHHMAQRKILFGERLPNAARDLASFLASESKQVE